MRNHRCQWVAVACSAAIALGPTITGASPPRSGCNTQPRFKPERNLLISGGVIGSVGLVATSLGFGIFGGIHAGNPGSGLSLVADDPAQGRDLLRTANSMMAVGMIGASLLMTGVILLGVGGHRLRMARTSRVTALVGLGSLGIRF